MFIDAFFFPFLFCFWKCGSLQSVFLLLFLQIWIVCLVHSFNITVGQSSNRNQAMENKYNQLEIQLWLGKCIFGEEKAF